MYRDGIIGYLNVHVSKITGNAYFDYLNTHVSMNAGNGYFAFGDSVRIQAFKFLMIRACFTYSRCRCYIGMFTSYN